MVAGVGMRVSKEAVRGGPTPRQALGALVAIIGGAAAAAACGDDATTAPAATSAASTGGGPASVGSGGPPATGGAGGAPECTVAGDCPGQDGDCQTRNCSDGTCGVDFAELGTACDEDGGSECDARGACLFVDPWVVLATDDAPAPRNRHTAVWTGEAMIVWGGRTGPGTETNDGAAYDPATDSWTAISSDGAPSARHSHTAVWTGEEMIVWGGISSGGFVVDGGRYNPTTNAWTATEVTSQTPSPRAEPGVAWSGNEMIVWGGRTSLNEPLADGAYYRPSTGSWKKLNDTGSPTARLRHCATWVAGGDHERFIVWGGFDTKFWFADGAQYDPVTNLWEPLAGGGALPAFRESMACGEVNEELFVWGGFDGGNYFDDGGLFPHAGTTPEWTAIGQTDAPDERSNMVSLVLDGDRFFVWGGCGGSACSTLFGDGGVYAYGDDGGAWDAIEATTNLSAREDHTAVWDGAEVIIWGGRENTTVLGDGARRTF